MIFNRNFEGIEETLDNFSVSELTEGRDYEVPDDDWPLENLEIKIYACEL